MSSGFLRPDEDIRKYGERLPHWEQEDVMQFVTFRLGDALPLRKIKHTRNSGKSGC